MVKSYLRHGPTEVFGLVAGSSSNSQFDGRRAFVPALEDVLVWDVKRGEQTAMWHETGVRSQVTCIARAPTRRELVAVGYADGSLRLWDSDAGAVALTFNGHRSAVTALAWDGDSSRLASGSKDTNIVVWDVVAEQGLFRLRGHRDQVTQLAFVSADETVDEGEDEPSTSAAAAAGSSAGRTQKRATHLLSASKDTFVKLFSLTTQHAVETIVAHRSAVWSLAYDAQERIFVTGAAEGDIKVWQINTAILNSAASAVRQDGSLARAIVQKPGLTQTVSSHTHNVTQLAFFEHDALNTTTTTSGLGASSAKVLGVLSGEKTVHVFRMRTHEEVKKRDARRRRRERERERKKATTSGGDVAGAQDDEEGAADDEWRDKLVLWGVVRALGKVRSFDFAKSVGGGRKARVTGAKDDLQIMLALANNALEVHMLPPASTSSKAAPVEPVKLHTLDLPGHRSDVRSLDVSYDDTMLASVSHGTLKIWNIKTGKCIRTMGTEGGYGTCLSWLPGDRHIVVGTKSGAILLYDIASSALLESFDNAHSGAVWSVHVRPDSRGLVSGSADKDVKFWDFGVREVEVEEEGEQERPKMRVLTMSHVRTLKMTDDVLAVKYSPDGKVLAVALLDTTVKVFYADTLKFWLSLYGHKLPVLALDISWDSKLIITCSADKNIKIWGLDFGDCHRSLFAHDESVMQVAFEKASHLFWSVGKDRMVKYWDADKFECIQKLEGHHGEIWALAVSRKAKFVLTGSHDKSIRLWEKTDEPLFLDEEREREMEELFDATLASNERADEMRVVTAGAPEKQDEAGETGDVSKQTTQTLMAGERIIDALEVSASEQAAWQAYEDDRKRLGALADKNIAPPTKSPVLVAHGDIGPQEYVLRVVRAIPAAQLQDALLVLPFSKVTQLMEHIDYWTSQEWDMALSARVLFFLLRTHHSQIVATRALRTTLVSLRGHLRDALGRQKDTIGYNLAALRYIKRQHDAARTAAYLEKDVSGVLDEDKVRQKLAEGAKKRRRATMQS